MTLISCNNITKRYGQTLALDNLSLTIGEGETVALIGPNGAGKTTLISILCGFIRPSHGTVAVLGHTPGTAALSGRLSALPQDAVLDPRLSIARQLRLFARLQGLTQSECSSEVSRVLDTVDLRRVADDRPDSLSHGMRKRIAIAQALLGEPEVVLLDEPTAGIDPPNAKIIRELIKQQSSSTTFIVSSHNLDELERLCSSVVYLQSGRLISHGPIEDSSNALQSGHLTLRLGDVPEAIFVDFCSSLATINTVRRNAQGDYVINCTDRLQASIDVLQLIKQQGWSYRQLSQGRTLEERLYGD